MNENIVGSIDVAEIAFYVFVLFFIALVFYLRREDRREGYPLEDELTGAVESPGGPLSTATPKVFALPFGRGTVTAPTGTRDSFDIAARRRENFGGAPYSPTGNPLTDGIGPAGFAQRARVPDIDAHGLPRIVPMSTLDGFEILPSTVDPRGLPVVAADSKVAGTITDLWVDRAEHYVRYFTVDTGAVSVLAPVAMAVVRRDRVVIDAINAADFMHVPGLEQDGIITRYEEERIIGYFGGGYLYANQERQEPWL